MLVNAKEYITDLETNAMILGIVSLSMKYFAQQIIRHTNNGGTFDDASSAELRVECIHYLKNIAAEGATFEQEATALNEALIMFRQMMDHAVAVGMADG
jgi:hypothetical protein